MVWVKLDDQFTEHPKVIMAGPLAGWLHVCGLVYCGRNLTDGFIPSPMVPRLATFEHIGITTGGMAGMFEFGHDIETQELADVLVDCGLWEEAEGGYMIHDYLEYNPSKAEVLAERKANAKRQKDFQERHRQSNGQFGSTEMSTNGVTNGVTNTSPAPVPAPVPDKKESKTHGDEASPNVTKTTTRKPSPQDETREALEIHFAEVTGISRPKGGTQNQKRGAGVLWWAPLREIAELCEWDRPRAIRLIDATVAHLRQDGMTIASPKSILATARAAVSGNAPGVSLPRAGPRTRMVVLDGESEPREVIV